MSIPASALYLMLVPFQMLLLFEPEVFVGKAHTKFGEGERLLNEATDGFLATNMEAVRAAIRLRRAVMRRSLL